MAGTGKRYSRATKKAIAMDLARTCTAKRPCGHVSVVAAKHGVKPVLLTRWKKNDPEFRAFLKEAQGELLRVAREPGRNGEMGELEAYEMALQLGLARLINEIQTMPGQYLPAALDTISRRIDHLKRSSATEALIHQAAAYLAKQIPQAMLQMMAEQAVVELAEFLDEERPAMEIEAGHRVVPQ